MKILIILVTMFVLVYNASGQYYTESWDLPPKDPAVKDSLLEQHSSKTTQGSITGERTVKSQVTSKSQSNVTGTNSWCASTPQGSRPEKSSGEIYAPLSPERRDYNKTSNEKRKRRDYIIDAWDYHSPVGEELSRDEIERVIDQMPYYQFPRKFKSDCVVGTYTYKYPVPFYSISSSTFMRYQRGAIEEAYKLFVKHLNEYCQKKGWPQVGKVGTTHKIEQKGSKVKEKFDYNSELRYNIAFTSHPIIVDYNTPKSNQITVYIYCDEIELIK